MFMEKWYDVKINKLNFLGKIKNKLTIIVLPPLRGPKQWTNPPKSLDFIELYCWGHLLLWPFSSLSYSGFPLLHLVPLWLSWLPVKQTNSKKSCIFPTSFDDDSYIGFDSWIRRTLKAFWILFWPFDYTHQ